MPKITTPLSEAAVRRLKNKGRHSVGGVPGLKLQIQETNDNNKKIMHKLL